MTDHIPEPMPNKGNPKAGICLLCGRWVRLRLWGWEHVR